MKANQFRIGNLVIANGELIEVDSINDIGINLRGGDGYGVYPDYEFREIKPIPLTEKLQYEGTLFFDDDFECFRIIANGKDYDFKTKDYPFLHQLQNLYFSLKGEKLILKSE